jgi:DNA polymerase V
MGFPSPARDYLEKRLDWNEIMSAHYEGTIMVETADGLVVVDTSIRPRQGDTIYFEAWDKRQLGKLAPTAIICEDGDTIEGEPLEEVRVIGVVTWVVTRAWDGVGPTI